MNNCESRVLYHKEKNIVLLGNLQIKDINYDGFSLIHPNSIIWEGNNWDSIFDMALDKLFSITNNDTLYYLNMERHLYLSAICFSFIFSFSSLT